MAKKSRRPTLRVRDSTGRRTRFLRGVLTYHLVERGVDFDSAYAVARAVRDRLAGRDEVDTAELRDLVAAQVEKSLGHEVSLRLAAVPPRRSGPLVDGGGGPQPFSRGLLARSISAAGLGLDRAYRLVQELEGDLLADDASGDARVSSDDLARRVGELLEQREGKNVARRYRMVRRLHRLPRPLVLYLGGASGTGKSTLAVELAPLLRVYRITATDTIRQVMRMIFSPQILPSIHGSSFARAASSPGQSLLEELLGLGRDDRRDDRRDDGRDDDREQRTLAAFAEQSVRVAVGVRAVVERAITEGSSLLVEGVHLVPPLVPFADLEGVCYQLPLILSVDDEETHRARFMARARFTDRHAQRYVDRFEAIRSIQDLLLEQAESEDVPTLDTEADDAAARALRLITSMLERRVPGLAQVGDQGAGARGPVLLLAIDGLADRPARALGGRTPLQAAATPTLDRLAREGRTGLAEVQGPGVVPDTASGTLALLAQSPLALERGPVEALGAGMRLAPGDVALRGNFATLDDAGLVVDRRAGRIRDEADELARALDRLALPGGAVSGLDDAVTIDVRPATEHRLAIVLRQDGSAPLSAAIRGSDPGDGAIPGPPLEPSALDPDDAAAVETARVLHLFESAAREVLAEHPSRRARAEAGLPTADAVLTRGAGRVHRLEPLRERGRPLRVTCIAGDRTIQGVARWIGAEVVSTETMTANLDTDLDAKLEAAERALATSDLVVLHVKGADIAAHDLRPDRKAEFLERFDAAVARLLDRRGTRPLRIAVGSDHATLSESGQHAADPVPVLIWGPGVEPDDVESFDETAVAAGGLGRFPLQALLGRLFELE